MAGLYSWAAGEFAKVFGQNATVAGYEAEAGEDSTATGFRARARGKTCTASGSGANAGGEFAQSNTVHGDDCTVKTEDAVGATGNGRLASVGRYGVAVGHNTDVAASGTGVGEGVIVAHEGSGALGRFATTTRHDQLVLGAPALPYKHINVSGRFVIETGMGAPTDPPEAPATAGLYLNLDGVGPYFFYVWEANHWEAK